MKKVSNDKENKVNKLQSKIKSLYFIIAMLTVLVIVLSVIISTNSSETALGQLIGESILAKKINRLDINKDGMVDITDVIVLKRHVLADSVDDRESDWYIADQEIDTDELPDQTGETITKNANISYQGYYADVDNDGTVDGVIYADLLAESGMSGKWSSTGFADYDHYGTYTIPTVTAEELKDYIISETGHTEKSFGTHDVLQMKNGSTGTDRFYVMSLSDIQGIFSWYSSAYNSSGDGKMTDYATATSMDFGTGKQNTVTIKRKWDYGEYGPKNENDIWGHIGTEVTKGWFVPSNGEWAAFAQYYGINKDNYPQYGLSMYYWSSSQYNTKEATAFVPYSQMVPWISVNRSDMYLRLSTTF